MRCPCCDCDYERKEEKELAIYKGMDAKQFQAMELALSRMEKTDRSAALKSRKQAKEAVSAEQWFGAVVRFYQRQLDISSMRFVGPSPGSHSKAEEIEIARRQRTRATMGSVI